MERKCVNEDGRRHHAKGLCKACYERKFRSVVRGQIYTGIEEVESQQPNNARLGLTYEDEWGRFEEWIGLTRKRQAVVPEYANDGTERFLLISDLHIPFHNEVAVLQAIDTGIRNHVQTVVVGGDALDCYSLSRFIHQKQVPIRQEFVEARKVFDLLSRSFPKVVVLTGNHEERERKHFSKKLTPDEMDWLLSKCILERVTEDMPNVRLVRERFYETDVLWFSVFGDCLVGHPEKSSNVVAKPVHMFKMWSDDWHEVYGFTRPRVIFMGHTHQFSAAWVGNRYISEIGCLCKIQEYALGPAMYSRPQRLGYVTFEQINGVTQIGSIRHHFPFADAAPKTAQEEALGDDLQSHDSAGPADVPGLDRVIPGGDGDARAAPGVQFRVQDDPEEAAPDWR